MKPIVIPIFAAYLLTKQEPVVRKLDSAIHRIAIFSTVENAWKAIKLQISNS